MNEMLRAREAHSRAIRDYEEAVNEFAIAEYEHDTTYAAAVAVERDEGTPVTIIDKVVKGIPEVAERRKERTIKEGLVKASSARIQATYNDWKVAMEYDRRDWLQSGMGDYDA